MTPILLAPVAVFSFLGGICLGKSRRGLSMLPPDRRAPLPGVPLAAWERFVAVMVTAPKTARTERGRLGYFGLDARRLADVGFMSGAHKTSTGAWSGQWRPPLGEELFLASAGAQYEALSRSMRAHAARLHPLVGVEVDGQAASLSGLLGVAHLAGTAGVRSWATDPAVRKKFRATTAAFNKTNGIF